MRKFIVTLVSVFVVAGLTASIATARHGKAHSSAPPALCGTLYKPACAPPGAVFSSIAACRAAGAAVGVPIRLHAIAGLKSATVLLKGHKVKTFNFKGRPQNRSVRVAFSTRGLRPGLYTFTVKVTDVRGVTRKRIGHFSICKPKPKFTG